MSRTSGTSDALQAHLPPPVTHSGAQPLAWPGCHRDTGPPSLCLGRRLGDRSRVGGPGAVGVMMTRGAGGRRPQVPGLPRRVPAHGARCKCGQNGNSPFYCFQTAPRLSRCSEADGKLDFLEPPQGCVRAIEIPPGVCPPHTWFTDVLVTFLPGTGAGAELASWWDGWHPHASVGS